MDGLPKSESEGTSIYEVPLIESSASRPTGAVVFSSSSSQNPSNKQLPQFVLDMIASVPQSGSGVHRWMFNVARQLHAHRTHDEIVELLVASVEGCGRGVPAQEIEAAVRDSKNVAWTPTDTPHAKAAKPVPKWPALDEQKQAAAIIGSEVKTADELRAASPISCHAEEVSTDWVLDQIFPGNPLLCVGLDRASFHTAPREELRDRLGKCSLIVPSPMTSIWGKTKSGKDSMHTLSNTGARRFLVTEFDAGTTDQQAALLWHLGKIAPLVMVVFSGGKSLHGWWDCIGADESELERFFRYAVSLGADPATWTRSQFVRLPQGWRGDIGRRQEVLFLNPKQGGHAL
jgi:hypothetical protein